MQRSIIFSMRSFHLLQLLLALVAIINASEIRSHRYLSLTIHSDQFAQVSDKRVIFFDQGISNLQFTDVAAKISPSTVVLRTDYSPDSVKIIEQNYQENLISTEAILKRYINQNLEISVKVNNISKNISGTLLGYNNGYILQTLFGIKRYSNIEGIKFPTLPKGLQTLPTLYWKVSSKKAFKTPCRVQYRTTGLSWKSDYLLTIKDEETKADLSGWVTIENNSGKKYENTQVRLIAGDVNTVMAPKNNLLFLRAQKGMALADLQPNVSSAEINASRVYMLSNAVTIDDRSQKQIELFPKINDLKVRIYNLITINLGGQPEVDLKVENRIEFENYKANRPGQSLPEGIVRVFKTDSSDGSLEFIGEESIGHTPKGENLTIKRRNASDITANKIVKYFSMFEKGYNANLNLTIFNKKSTKTEIVIDINKNPEKNVTITWRDENLSVEVVSASLLRIRRFFSPNQTYSLFWHEYYRY